VEEVIHRATIGIVNISKAVQVGIISPMEAADLVSENVGATTACGVDFKTSYNTWEDKHVECEDCIEIMTLNILGALP
jgi:hypothetical protein